MKAIFLFTCLLLLSAGALMAQSTSPKAARSTKYRLFPDYDADIARLNKPAQADNDNSRSTVRNTKELIFKDYKPQQTQARPTVQQNARKAPADKTPSDATDADRAKVREEAVKPVKTIPAPTQESQAPKQ